jgi:hypothetical protein
MLHPWLPGNRQPGQRLIRQAWFLLQPQPALLQPQALHRPVLPRLPLLPALLQQMQLQQMQLQQMQLQQMQLQQMQLQRAQLLPQVLLQPQAPPPQQAQPARALPFLHRSDQPLARRQPGARRDRRPPVNASTSLSPRNSMCGRIEMVQPSLEHT